MEPWHRFHCQRVSALTKRDHLALPMTNISAPTDIETIFFPISYIVVSPSCNVAVTGEWVICIGGRAHMDAGWSHLLQLRTTCSRTERSPGESLRKKKLRTQYSITFSKFACRNREVCTTSTSKPRHASRSSKSMSQSRKLHYRQVNLEQRTSSVRCQYETCRFASMARV